MEKIVASFIEYIQNTKGLSKNTVASYRRDLTKFLDYVKMHNITDISSVTEVTCNSFLMSLENQGASSASIARMISTMHSFFLYLLRDGVIQKDPSENLKAPVRIRILTEKLDLKHVNNIVENIKPEGERSLRDILIIKILAETKMNASDIIDIKVENVELNYQVFKFKKNGKEKVIEYSDEIKALLTRYLKDISKDTCEKGDQEDDKCLFLNYRGTPLTRQGVWKILHKYDENMTPRSLRQN